MRLPAALCVFLRSFFLLRAALAAENLALRQQLAVLRRSTKRPRLRRRDRIFWVRLSKLWKRWRSALVIVQLDTAVKWHRQGFPLHWRWKSKTGKVGRPRIDTEIRRLIRQMCRENPTWATPHIHAELLLLGSTLAPSTVNGKLILEQVGEYAGLPLTNTPNTIDDS